MSTMYGKNDGTNTRVIGNISAAAESVGFKEDIKDIFEKYAAEGSNIGTDLYAIIGSPTAKEAFIELATESVSASPALTSQDISGDAFYSNYPDRLSQLTDNSLGEIATEAVMTGYAPIVAYAPFFLKKQWVNCIWKDVLMTEVPDNPIINYQFQKRYIRSLDGTDYEIPNVYYNKDVMKKLLAESTGAPILEEPIDLPMNNICLIDPSKNADPTKQYIADGFVARDPQNALTPDIRIQSVILVDAADGNKEIEVPTNITIALPSTNFEKGKVIYHVKDGDGNILRTLEDEIVGKVDFDTGCVTAIAVNGVAKKIKLAGKTANRFNHRSLDVKRTVEQIQKIMPESGPRLNSAITIEEAADALALNKIDMFADNVDMMGNILANLEDLEIKQFIDASFDVQKNAQMGPHGYEDLIVEGSFSAIPLAGYGQNITSWMQDSKEYFERILEQLKYKLNTSECIITCVCHPSLVRFIKADIRWVFSNETDISGLKLQYDLGVVTANGDKVHIITSRYMDADEGIRFIVIPTTKDLITYKHLKYSVTVDRGYRHPLEPLVPNIMATQRCLTFEVVPCQAKLTITGREAYTPTSQSGTFPVAVSGSVKTTT